MYQSGARKKIASAITVGPSSPKVVSPCPTRGPTVTADGHADVDRASRLDVRCHQSLLRSESRRAGNAGGGGRRRPPPTAGVDQAGADGGLDFLPAFTYSARFGSGASNQAFGGAKAEGSFSPKAATISLFWTSAATPFCCAEAYW